MSKTKNDLKSRFKTGMRPTEKDFEDLIESMITGEDDKIYSKGDKVGIGIKDPTQKLQIDGAIKVGDTDNENADAGTIRFNNNAFEGSDGTNWVKFGGESIWKSSSPATSKKIIQPIKLDPNTQVEYILDFDADTLIIDAKKIVLRNDTDSSVIQIENGSANISTTSGSDQRLKNNIRPYERGLEAVVQMNPCKFYYNGKLGIKEGLEKIGLIAQDLEKAAPELVYVNSAIATAEIPDPLYIKSDEIIYLAINAIKELNQKVVALEAEIKTLKGGGA